MKHTLQPIDAKNYQGDLILLYGDDVAERTLPLSKKEIEYLRTRREAERDCLLVFDRLPNHLYILSFDSEKPAALCQELVRRRTKDLLSLLEQHKVEQLALSAMGTLPEEVAAFVEGLAIADYSFDRYKGKAAYHLDHLVIDSLFLKDSELQSMQHLLNRIFWCREWVNLPQQDLDAVAFADELQSVAADLDDVSATVYNLRQIQSLRMGGLLAVNRGSSVEPRFLVLEYKPGSAAESQPIALVGKGVMYDTGGLNIKPDDYMQEMKSDMAGAATMASLLFAAADNHLPVHLVALLPLTDNRPGPGAYAPDDILTMYDGTTVEVVNTDAEGRLILADAIAFAAKNFNPRLIVTAATLTGAAVRAISTYGIAAMQKDAQNPLTMLSLVGQQVYERIVEFPLWDEYAELIKSDYADLRNCGTTPQAGTITAGLFLSRFAHGVPFIHLDIAGVAYFTKPQHFYRAGASAYGLRLLYAFLQMQ